MAELLYRIGGFASRRSGIVIVTWVAILALAGVAFAFGGGHLANGLSIPGTPTAQVTERLAAEFPAAAGGNGTIVFQTEDGTPFTDAQKAAITARIAAASDIDGVTQVVDPFATQAARDDPGAADHRRARRSLTRRTAQLEQGQAQLDAARAQAKASGTLDQAAAGLAAKQAELDEGKAQLDAQRSKLEDGAALLQMSSGIRLVSDDGSAAVAPVMFTDTQFEVSPATKKAVQDAFSRQPIAGVSVDFSSEIASGIPSIIGGGELVGLVVAAIVLVAMLGTLIGAGLPILSALVGVGIGVLAALSLSGVVEMVSVTPVLGVMLGLAVGIDYSLFIVNRHRRQLKEGYSLRESISLATGTSGNAVVFAGMTVFIALLGAQRDRDPLPGRDGHRRRGLRRHRRAHRGDLHAGHAQPHRRARPQRSRARRAHVCRRPRPSRSRSDRCRPDGRSEASCSASPCSAPWPFPRCRCGSACPTARRRPRDRPSTRRTPPSPRSSAPASTARSSSSPTSRGPRRRTRSSPSRSASGGSSPRSTMSSRSPRSGRPPTGPRSPSRSSPPTDRSSVSTEQLVKELRAASPLDGGVQIAVAGQASGNIDISQKLADALPLYLALVVGLSLLIMVVVFRSLFVPVIATGGFILSLFAAFGAVVAIYQWGWLGGIFGVHTGPILNFLPTILVGILFGLAMDYMLFLTTGMREAYVHGAPARTAVVLGVRAGRSVVTAAAIIMVSVFGGFVFSESAIIPADRLRARHRRPARRVRRADVHRPVADAPRR